MPHTRWWETAEVCVCGGQRLPERQHRRVHQLWETGVPVPAWLWPEQRDAGIVRVGRDVPHTERAPAERLLEAFARECNYALPSLDALARDLNRTHQPRSTLAFLALRAGRVVGLILVSERSQWKVWHAVTHEVTEQPLPAQWRVCVDMIWVAAAWRRQGIGTALVEHAAAAHETEPVHLAWFTPFGDDGLGFAVRFSWSEGWLYIA